MRLMRWPKKVVADVLCSKLFLNIELHQTYYKMELFGQSKDQFFYVLSEEEKHKLNYDSFKPPTPRPEVHVNVYTALPAEKYSAFYILCTQFDLSL